MKTKKLENPTVGTVVSSDSFHEPQLGFITAVFDGGFSFRSRTSAWTFHLTEDGVFDTEDLTGNAAYPYISLDDFREVTAMTRRELDYYVLSRDTYSHLIDDTAVTDDYDRDDIGMFEMSLTQTSTVRIIGAARSAESFEKQVRAIDPDNIMAHWAPIDLEKQSMYGRTVALNSAPITKDILRDTLRAEAGIPLPLEDLDDRIGRAAQNQDLADAARDFIAELGLGQAFSDFLARREAASPEPNADSDDSTPGLF